MLRSNLAKQFPILTLILAFFPYLAVPVGASSNVPIACLAAAIHIALSRIGREFLPIGILIASPLIGTFVGTLLWPEYADGIFGSVLFAVWVLPAISVAIAVRGGLSVPIMKVLKGITILAALAAILQWVFILQGNVPFANLYNLQGYPPVAPLAESIVLYNQRPFAWFPEPSFLAATLILALVSWVVLKIQAGGVDSGKGLLWLTPVAFALFLTLSGAIAVTLPLLLLLLYKTRFPQSGPLVARFFIIVAGISAMILSRQLISTRDSDRSWSWADRYASTFGVLREVISEPGTLFLGLGRDGGVRELSRQAIPLDDLVRGFYPRGIYSVIIRLLAEGGVIFGWLPLIAVVLVVIHRLSRTTGILVALLSSISWILIAALAVSYDTASLVWVALGIFVATPRTDSSAEVATPNPSVIQFSA